ncbi:MAG: glutathione peroxidase [Pirellula sp.]|jgi:glutathione peroxidase
MDGTIYSLQARTNDGQEISLDRYRGRVLLIVNLASKCGFTPQYSDLQALQDEYGERGFSVLGFPCNQFGMQEPGTDAEIREFCSLNYNVTFDLFAKVEVNGPKTHPVYQLLKNASKGILGSESIKWNFTKFLVDRTGRVVDRYSPMTNPKKLRSAIEKALGESA